jgi:hypothetical protein
MLPTIPISRFSTTTLKGLVIAEPWISLILSGRKTWQMCPKVSKYRGPIALVSKGSLSVVGIADLVHCIPRQHGAEYRATEPLHFIPRAQQRDAAAHWPVAWVFENARSLLKPVPYRHKNGAQSQIVLSEEESAAVFAQDRLIKRRA